MPLVVDSTVEVCMNYICTLQDDDLMTTWGMSCLQVIVGVCLWCWSEHVRGSILPLWWIVGSTLSFFVYFLL